MKPAIDDSSGTLEVRDLGRMPYAEAFALQKSLQQEVIDRRREADADGRGASAGILLLVEHDPPVITVSRRKEARSHLLAGPEQLAAAGVEVHETDRGGDITLHGPGQLVVYPILDLNVLGLRLHGYMRLLEGIVIDAIASYGVTGRRDTEATGVWVERDGVARKVCAMGVRVSRWVTMHGLALNVENDLGHFDLIVPCGLAGREVTSLQRELGDACPSIGHVKRDIAAAFTGATDSDAQRR